MTKSQRKGIYCVKCGKELTRAKSIERRMGAICFQKQGIEPLLNLTKIFDRGVPTAGEDKYPPLDFYIIQITNWKCKFCGRDLHDKSNIQHYKHERGVLLHGFQLKQWLFLRCKVCGGGTSLATQFKREWGDGNDG